MIALGVVEATDRCVWRGSCFAPRPMDALTINVFVPVLTTVIIGNDLHRSRRKEQCHFMQIHAYIYAYICYIAPTLKCYMHYNTHLHFIISLFLLFLIYSYDTCTTMAISNNDFVMQGSPVAGFTFLRVSLL